MLIDVDNSRAALRDAAATATQPPEIHTVCSLPHSGHALNSYLTAAHSATYRVHHHHVRARATAEAICSAVERADNLSSKEFTATWREGGLA